MPKNIFEFFPKPILLDGGWGTTLIAQEGFQQQCFAQYNLTKPQKIDQIASDFLQSGSEILLTNTFQASPLALEPFNCADQWQEINRRGIQISLNASQKKALVFASMGPFLPLHQKISRFKQRIQKEAREQALLFEETGAQGIVLETFTHREETKLVVETVLNAVSIPVGLSACFGFGEKQIESPIGWSITEFIQDFGHYPLSFWGANCGSGFQSILTLIPYFSSFTKPVWLKPNIQHTPNFQAPQWPQLFHPSVYFIGGCCGTTPDHIRSLKEARTQFFQTERST